MTKYGEPWTCTDDPRHDTKHIVDIRGNSVYMATSGWSNPHDDTRIKHSVACVNALAGIENPEAVKGLMDAMRLVCELASNRTMSGLAAPHWEEIHDMARKALAKLNATD